MKQKICAGLLIVAKTLAVTAQTAVYSVHVNVFIANQPIRIPVWSDYTKNSYEILEVMDHLAR